MPESETELAAAQKLLDTLRDCPLLEWEWTDANQTLLLRLFVENLAGRKERDVVVCLFGVSRLVFECDDDKENDDSLLVSHVSLAHESTPGRRDERYRLQLGGEITLEAVGRTFKVMEQAPLGSEDAETVATETAMFADLNGMLTQWNELTDQINANRPASDGQINALQDETRTTLNLLQSAVEKMQNRS